MSEQITFRGWSCQLVRSTYSVDGSPALLLIDAENGEPIAKATIYVEDEKLGPDEVVIKDYSENAGMLDALVNAGIVEPTGRSVQLPFCTAPVCRLVI